VYPVSQARARRLTARYLYQKEASPSDGKTTGDSTKWTGMFIQVPGGIADQFPDRQSEEDKSPTHCTFLYVGNVKGKEQEFLDAVRRGLSGGDTGSGDCHVGLSRGFPF